MMSNPNIAIFDHIRWKEFGSVLALLSVVLKILKDAPLAPETKQWVGIAVSVLSTAAAFLRNPKRLEWVEPTTTDGTNANEGEKL